MWFLGRIRKRHSHIELLRIHLWAEYHALFNMRFWDSYNISWCTRTPTSFNAFNKEMGWTKIQFYWYPSINISVETRSCNFDLKFIFYSFNKSHIRYVHVMFTVEMFFLPLQMCWNMFTNVSLNAFYILRKIYFNAFFWFLGTYLKECVSAVYVEFCYRFFFLYAYKKIYRFWNLLLDLTYWISRNILH